MRFATFIFYVIGAIGLCAALPIPKVTVGDRNTFILGALAFTAFGAIVAGCVCCRRRKQGFEEFKNESGTLDSGSKIEYPIFRALSPESQRNASATNAGLSAVNNSNENLIADDFDNNNGPISPMDLENIQNNNAVDYIQNQNEVGIEIEASSYSRNRNIIPTVITPNDELQNFERPTQDLAISSINELSNSRRIPESVENTTVQVISVVQNDISDRFEMDTFHKNSEPIFVKENANLQKEVPILNSDCNLFKDIPVLQENITLLESTVIRIDDDDDENFNNNEIVAEKVASIPNESSSLKSNSSDRSAEINSVEEALRALDSAIAGEELNNDDCDDDNDHYDDDEVTGKIFECNDTNFQNVIRQLLIENGVNNFLPDLIKDQCNLNVNNEKLNDNLEYIRTEAKLFVESILIESEKVAYERIGSLNDAIKKGDDDETTIRTVSECILNNETVFSSKFEDEIEFIPKDLYDNFKTEKDPLHLNKINPAENFFCMLGATSTPCAQKVSKCEYKTVLPNNKLVQKLFDPNEDMDKSSLTNIVDDIEIENINEIDLINEKTQILADNEKTITISPMNNQTFPIDKTFDVSPSEDNKEFIHPGDPCTSKQAIERDYAYPLIKYEREDVTSEDLTTITPLNTPIELNYPNDTWDKMTKSNLMIQDNIQNNDLCQDNSGWFLHPQSNNAEANETFDVEEDDTNLELTFEALRKQLAEVLPQPQGMTGRPEFSDDEDEQQNNRTFDEYRSPLDGLLELLDVETPAPTTGIQNELFINYKRPLSPIIEESEDETCKTFVLNETKCLDSTSTGCVDTGEAIMGVTKTLMASNDTLFNFEDTLGEKEDVFSPRTPSRNETQANTPIKSGKSTEENSIATTGSETIEKSDKNLGIISTSTDLLREKKSPPKTIDIIQTFELTQDGELCSPEQQKTFSEGTSSATDHVSSDISPTIDYDTTFTTNTIDDKTCITVIIKDDERISEISEPEWGSTASYGGYEMNSLIDVPSLDFNINNFEEQLKSDDKEMKSAMTENILSSTLHGVVSYHCEKHNSHDDSGHSTQTSIVEKSTSNNTYEPEIQIYGRSNISETIQNPDTESLHNLNHILDSIEECQTFIKSEIEFSSSQMTNIKMPTNIAFLSENEVDSGKENTDPNLNIVLNNSIEVDKISYQKVQSNSQDAVIMDKFKIISSSDLYEKESPIRVPENIFHQPVLPTKHPQTITNYSVSDVEGMQNEQNCLIVADEVLGHLSGEEDPWVGPISDICFTGPCSEIISTSFTVNEWDSDIDDSHSSEEFLYVRGTPPKSDISPKTSNQFERNESEIGYTNFDETLEPHMWSSHEDKIPVGGKKNNVEEISEDSSSEFEGEFVPSSWDSMATPVRSALKSPDKSSSDKKKRRSVAFKKQRYHSVYEYPRENTSLSPAYSEPFLWNQNSAKSLYSDEDCSEEFNDGFVVSSSMRPFHGSQFNALCHTWPPDSDFSWSQIESLDGIKSDKHLVTYSDIDGKWPQNLNNIYIIEKEEDENKKKKNIENGRPDSGVGESADMLNDRVSLGELRHTKSNLRLPLELIPSPETITYNADLKPEESIDNELIINKDSIILPTPSCTGSMDSLSSSSGSERQISFSTFGKPNSFNETDKKSNIEINNDQIRPALILIENEPIEISNNNININNINSTDKIKQSDSTDEDSGIESIMKVNKESD